MSSRRDLTCETRQVPCSLSTCKEKVECKTYEVGAEQLFALTSLSLGTECKKCGQVQVYCSAQCLLVDRIEHAKSCSIGG